MRLGHAEDAVADIAPRIVDACDLRILGVGVGDLAVGPGGAPGCWQNITRDFWPAPYLVADTGASIAPYNHFELGQPILNEYVWGRQIGEYTINP